MLTLSGLDCLLKKSTLAKDIFRRMGGTELVERLQLSPFHEVFKLAADMMELHFDGQQMDDDERDCYVNSNVFKI